MLVVVALALLGCLARAVIDSDTGYFIAFSDFHVDPYYGSEDGLCATPGPALGMYGCDSPWALVEGLRDSLR